MWRTLSIVLIIISYIFTFSCGPKNKQYGSSGVRAIDEENTKEVNKTKEEGLSLPKLTKKNVAKVLKEFSEKHPEQLVRLRTKFGDMKIKLYEGTPLHRANFLQLVKRNYYDGTVFHRVVKDLVIQGGNLDDPIIRRKKNEVGFYRVPSEFQPQAYFHKKGALASPRRDENNPDKLSNPFEFYIVQGSKLAPALTQAIGAQNNVQYTPEQIQIYASLGGLPHLDNRYTVFGEVIEGLDIIDKIAAVEVDKDDDWPFEDIEITMEVLASEN